MVNWRGQADYATLGLNVVLSVLLGFGAGTWLDNRLATGPYLAVLGFVFGVAAAIRFILRASKKMAAATESDGFQESSTDRGARYELEQKEKARGKR